MHDADPPWTIPSRAPPPQDAPDAPRPPDDPETAPRGPGTADSGATARCLLPRHHCLTTRLNSNVGMSRCEISSVSWRLRTNLGSNSTFGTPTTTLAGPLHQNNGLGRGK